MRRRALAAVALGAVLLVPLGCSSSGGGDGGSATPTTGGSTTLVPSSTGDRCTDPTGDVDAPAGADVVALAGIDLTTMSALVQGDQLVVDMQAAGPVAAAPDPTFVVAQGDPLQPLSFELRMEPTGGTWKATLITWPSGAEVRKVLDQPVTVGERSVGITVPLALLPPIALSMQFGASSQVSPNVFAIDDCTSLLNK